MKVELAVLLLAATAAFAIEIDSANRKDPNCPKIFPPKNGKMKMGKFFDVATVTCNAGYKLNGKQYISCLNGKWNAPVAKCKPIKCNPFPNVPNMNGVVVTNKGYYPSNATINCQIGSRVEMTATPTCNTKGVWVNVPACKRFGCPGLDIKHGTRMPNFVATESGTKIDVECDEGFKLKGSASVTCTDSGEWTPLPGQKFPKCKARGCRKYKETLENGDVHLPGVNSAGSVIHFTCKPGYKLVADGAVECDSKTYEWIGTRPTCQKIHCPRPPKVPNMAGVEIIGKWPKYAFYICNPGYRRKLATYEGKKKYPMCTEDGDWDDITKCVPYKCPLPFFENGMIVQSRNKLFFKCISGYSLEGPTTATCQDGKWSKVPTCLDTNLI